MNKKIIKKILIIITLFLSLIVAYRVINIYALFYSEAKGVIKQNNATWVINVNNKNIVAQASNKFSIDTIEFEPNTHVLPGKIAPNSSGNFYIVIDPKDTKVSVKYCIEFDETKLINDKINIVSVEEIEKKNKLIKTGENTYTGIIPLNEIIQGATNKIKIKINWQNDELNNKMDTVIGTIKDYTINIPINVTVTQYLGETIEEYIPQEII